MQPSAQHGARYERGVKHLRPDVADRIREALRADPTISKAALALRVGVTRQTVIYYLRAMGDEVDRAAAEQATVRARRVESHLDLVAEVGDAITAIRAQIGKLGDATDGRTAGAIFRGYATLERYLRLQGELLGEVAPPTQNTYLVRVEALLSAEVDPSRLSPAIRRAVAG